MHPKFSKLFRNAFQIHQKCFPTENNTNEPKNSIFLQNKAIIPPDTQEISSINGQKFTSLKKTPKKAFKFLKITGLMCLPIEFLWNYLWQQKYT